jgi:DNA invertase Pin-like site-specific DNA recombinase
MAKKTAYSYIRFSTPEQIKGDSLRRQLAASESWCQRNGYTLDSHSYRDLGISAFKGNNVAMGKLGAFIEAVDNGSIQPGSVLILESLDRLTRQEVPDALELFLGILRRGIVIITLEPEDRFERKTLNEIQLIIAIVILSRAHNESSTKSGRGNANWQNKRANIETKKLTKRGPGWLRLVDNQWEVIEEKAQVVRDIFEKAANGMGVGRITRFLNDYEIPSLTGKAWGMSSVLKVLRSRSVFGEFTPRHGRGSTSLDKRPIAGESIPDYYTPILSEADFYAAERGLRQRASKGGPVGKKVTNLFSGKLFYSDGFVMNVTDKGGGPHIVSSGARRAVKGAAKYRSFSLDAFERTFLEIASGISPDQLFPPVDHSAGAKELKAAMGQLGTLNRKLRELNKQIEGDADLSVLLPAVKNLSNQKQALEAKIAELKEQQSNAKAECLNEVGTISKLMAKTTGDKLIDLRTRLRARIDELLERVDIDITDDGSDRTLTADCKFTSGRRVTFELTRSVKYSGGGTSNPMPKTVFSFNNIRLQFPPNVSRIISSSASQKKELRESGCIA